VAQKGPLSPLTSLFGLMARPETELEVPVEDTALPENTELRVRQYH
jgi:hypothetical protein